MARSISEKAERVISSFASLLSSAVSVDGGMGLESLSDSSEFLSRFISPLVPADDVCLILPSVRLKHGSKSSSKESSLEESIALNLAQTMKTPRSQIEGVPMSLLSNLCDSFKSLIESRLRSSIEAFVRHSRQQRDPTLTRVLVGLLACSESPISLSTVVTSFRTLPACEITASGEVIMPLVLDCIVDLTILGSLVTVTMVAPGTIQTALTNDYMIQKTEIVLDTLALLQSMMKQARFAVRKAVAIGTNLATALLIPSSPTEKSVVSEATSTPNSVSSSQGLKLQLGAQESSSLMPPPPRRPSKRSLVDLSNSSKSEMLNNSRQNASWEKMPIEGDSGTSLGLSLLTAAANLNVKKRRTDDVT